MDARVARFIPNDISEPDDVKSWLSENGDLFGATSVEAQPDVDAAARMANMTETAAPADAGDIFAKMAGASTEEELNQRAVFQLRGAGEAATQVPTQVLVERSIEELCMALRTSGASTRAYGVAKVRSFGRPVLVGEPVALLTTVGFRGRGQDDAIFATMFVEVRRGNGTTALKFEVGVEVAQPPAVHRVAEVEQIRPHFAA